MNQIKIGKFIAERRKAKDMTQAELSERVNVTDRAVSKWETGRGLPDASVMLLLCNELGITVNELLSGEAMDMQDYNKSAEKNLLEMAKREGHYNRRLYFSMCVIGIMGTLFLLSMVFVVGVASTRVFDKTMKLLAIVPSIILFLICIFIALKLEAEVGYYECKNCHHKFIPSYKAVIVAPHIFSSRHLKCPECGKKSWAKKVFVK